MAQQVTTVTTVVPIIRDEGLQRQLKKLGERDSDLAHFGRNGWVLAHSHAIDGTDYTTFIDTLTRDH